MTSPVRSMVGTAGAALCLLACAQVHDGVDETASAAPKLPSALATQITENGEGDVLVELDESTTSALAPADGAADSGSLDTTSQPSAVADDTDPDGVQTRAALYRSLQERVLAVADAIGVEPRIQYQHLPLMLMHVKSAQALEALAAQPEVLRIHEDRHFAHQLAQSLPLIRQPAALAAGQGGAGTSVVVLDSGCDFTRAAFGSCSEAGAAGCKVAYAADFAANDGSRDDSGHGTNVSAIVLGVAPSTKVIALDVFAGTSAASSTILSAIDWSIQNRAKYNIVAMNMSLGGGSFSASCGNDVFASALTNARASGILSAVSSGNDGATNAIASPACVPAAISVGAVYSADVGGLSYSGSGCQDTSTKADQITCFSNSSSFLSMLAPGALITAGGLTMAGTSQAAPHVAGALAVLRAAFPSEAVGDTVARLINNGPVLTDPRNKIAKRRLDLQAALVGSGSGSGSGTATPDKTGPTGSATLNAGADATRATAVSLAISGSDPSGVSAMCVSNTTTCTSFQAFSTSLSWNLASGDGVKTVYVTLRDTLGNVSKVSDAIRLDTKAPTGGTLSASASSNQIALTWTAASDGGSPVSYALYAGGSVPACGSGQRLYSGSATSFVHTGLRNGTAYGYRLCPVDAVGNVGTGSGITARPAPETQAPVGGVQINGGASYANSTSVSLTLSARDASGIGAMCISNSATCTSWTPFVASKAWTLATKSGVAKVNVWYKDIYENVMTQPVTASITVDTAGPTQGGFTAAAAGGQVSLSWSAAVDASGVDAYKLYWQTGSSAPSRCGVGTLAYSGTGLGFAHTARPAGTYSYRLCAYDRLGNGNAGLTKTATVR